MDWQYHSKQNLGTMEETNGCSVLGKNTGLVKALSNTWKLELS